MNRIWRISALGLAAGLDGLALVNRILLQSINYLSEHGILVIEVGNSQPAMMQRYDGLPMTWIDFEYGGGGVCCLQAQDLREHYDTIQEINSEEVA